MKLVPLKKQREERRKIAQDILKLARWNSITDVELAQRAGISRQALYYFRKRNATPHYRTIVALLDACEMTDVKWKKVKQEIAAGALTISKDTIEHFDSALAISYRDLSSEKKKEITLLMSNLLRNAKEIGAKIYELRKQKKGWTQEELAKSAGISKGFAYDLESGRWRGSWMFNLQKVANALDVSLDALFLRYP